MSSGYKKAHNQNISIDIDIQAEILKRLPLKPLIQFRCVSKRWKRLIDSPCFIAFYGVRHPRPHRLILRYEDNYIPNNMEPFNSFVDEYDNWYLDSSFITRISVPDLLFDCEGYPFVVGSSHGLLCFKKLSYDYHTRCYDSEMVVIWNPSIRKYVCIPVPDSPYYNFRNDPVDDDVIGFGVCPVTFDPTILKIKRVDYKSETKDISLPWRVRVFTMSTKTWSILSTNMPRESIRLKGSQVVIDRFIYWIAFDMLLDSKDDRSQSPFLIISFDLIAKEFKEINLADSLTNRLCSIQSISKLQESLVLLEYHREFEEGVPVCCLWMMEDQGDNRSFTKLCNINMPDATVKTLLGFTKIDELILVTQKQKESANLKIYDPFSESGDDLNDHFDLFSGDDYSFFVCSYMETLLLLDHLDGFIYSISI